MADILGTITRYKLEEIARAKEAVPLHVLAELARERAELVREIPNEHVGAAAGGEVADRVDVLHRILLRRGAAAGQDRADDDRGRGPSPW